MGYWCVYMSIYTYVCSCVCIHMAVPDEFTYVHGHAYLQQFLKNWHVCMCLCIHTAVPDEHMTVYVCLYTHTTVPDELTCMHVYVYIQQIPDELACVHVYVNIQQFLMSLHMCRYSLTSNAVWYTNIFQDLVCRNLVSISFHFHLFFTNLIHAYNTFSSYSYLSNSF